MVVSCGDSGGRGRRTELECNRDYRQLAYGFRSVSCQSATNSARRERRPHDLPQEHNGRTCRVFSVLLFVDRAPDGGVSDTAVDEARSIPLIARNAKSGAPRNGPKN
jgi:hypothetical protein